MKPTDPIPEEYVKWIMWRLNNDYGILEYKLTAKFILTELRDNSTTEINILYFNECLTELKKL